MPLRRISIAARALEAGLRAEHADDLPGAVHHYAEAAIHAGDDPTIVTQALTRQAGVYRRLSEWDMAADYARRARELAEDEDLPALRADALAAEGNALMCSGRFDEAAAVYHWLARVAMDDRQRGIAMQNLGSIHAQREEWPEAANSFAESHAMFSRAAYARGVAIATNNLGRLAHDMGDPVTAERLLDAALLSAREVEDAELAALALLNLAQVRIARGRLDDASLMVAEAHSHFLECDNRWRQVECHCVLADIAQGHGEALLARQHLETGRALAREINAKAELERIEARLASA